MTKPSADPILDAKLHRPPTRADWVERDRLLELLDRAVERPVTLVAAPAGFGKTTLATQWLASNRAPRVAAWVSLDSRDNDPVRLWTHVAIALERAGCCRSDQDVAAFMAAHGGEVIAEVLPRLLASIADMDEDLVILLDDFHFLRDVDCHTQVEFLVENLPQQAHLVVLTRADPGLRIAWLRATGRLSEIRAADLAFTAEETSSLLAVEQVRLSSGSVRDLVQRTEGWAAGLYLATLSMAGRSDPDEFVREVSEGNRFIGDYLTEEVLAGLSDEVRQFIRTMSILDRFSAPLADYMTGSSNSAALLARARTQQPVPDPVRREAQVVPVPSPVRLRGAQRPGAGGARAGARPARGGRALVPRPRPHRRGRDALAGLRQQQRCCPAGAGQLAPVRRRRPDGHSGRLARLAGPRRHRQ